MPVADIFSRPFPPQLHGFSAFAPYTKRLSAHGRSSLCAKFRTSPAPRIIAFSIKFRIRGIIPVPRRLSIRHPPTCISRSALPSVFGVLGRVKLRLLPLLEKRFRKNAMSGSLSLGLGMGQGLYDQDKDRVPLKAESHGITRGTSRYRLRLCLSLEKRPPAHRHGAFGFWDRLSVLRPSGRPARSSRSSDAACPGGS